MVGGGCLYLALAQVGINADLTVGRFLVGFPGEILQATTPLGLILCKHSARIQLPEYRLIARLEGHRGAYAALFIIEDSIHLYPLPTPSFGCPLLPTC